MQIINEEPIVNNLNHAQNVDIMHEERETVHLTRSSRINQNVQKTDIGPTPNRTLIHCSLYEDNLLSVEIAGRHYSVILDTGADKTVVSPEFYNMLKRDLKISYKPIAAQPMNTAGKSKLVPVGDCEFPIKIEGHTGLIKARILKGLQPSILVGNDFFRANEAVIDFAKARVKLHFQNIPVRTIKKVSLPPMSESSIPVWIDGKVPIGLVGEVTPIEYEEESPLIGARIVTHVFGENRTAVRILNMSDTDWVVDKNQTVGMFNGLKRGELIEMPTSQPPVKGEARPNPPPNKLPSKVINNPQPVKPPVVPLGRRDKKCTEWNEIESLQRLIKHVSKTPSVRQISEDENYDQSPFKEEYEAEMSWNDRHHSSPQTLEPIKEENIDLGGSYLTTEQKKEITDLIMGNRDVFALSLQELGCARGPPCRIHLKPGAKPVRSAPYRASPIVQREIDTEIEKMLRAGVISPSDSEFSSPIVVVNKSDGGVRICIDYRRVNEISLFDCYPLPPIHHALDILGHAKPKFLTHLDLASGYWQLPLHESDKEITAFCTIHGLYQFNVLPFGLNSAGAKFCRFIGTVLRGILNKSAFAYVDDILIASPTFEKHLNDLQEVFDRLRYANLRLKLTKCHFAQRKVKFLGHIVSEEGIAVDPDKIQAVLSFPTPKCVKNVRQFLGLTSFYRRHVEGYSHIASPMNALLRKSNTFAWTPECAQAMQSLKKALTQTPVLAYPEYDQPFILYTDASKIAIGAILCQKNADDKERVIGYHGRSLGKAEKNYSNPEREI